MASQDTGRSQIQVIARRNLRLALVTVVSTAISMVVVTNINLTLQSMNESSSSRSYYYLRHVATLAAVTDMAVNIVAMLMMTSSWQPACLKRQAARFSTKIAYKGGSESEVSSLGGG
jgi:hypothetical protein